MQIRNDYTSFQNRSYQENHTHHITECLAEEPVKKNDGATGASKSRTDRGENITFSRDGDTYRMSVYGNPVQKRTKQPDSNLLKGFWDALGDKGTENSKSAITVLKDHLLPRIHGAATSIRDILQHQVVDRVQNTPVKVKGVLKSARTNLKRGRDAFATLTKGQTSPRRNHSGAEKRSKDGQVTSTGKKEDIPMKVLKHSHLTDSYSRKGEYCQLNDNLTYGNSGTTNNKHRNGK